MKFFLFILFFLTNIWALSLTEPLYTFTLKEGLATDVLVSKGRLYIANDTGKVFVYDLKSKKALFDISVGKIHDFMGDEVASKIFNLDMFKNNLLILSQDDGGYSRLHIYADGALKKVVSSADHYNIIRAKFVDENRVIMALISNDILSFDVKTHKINWTTQASMSKFSSFALSDDKKSVAVADESGEVHLLSTESGEKIKSLSGENVDNIFSIDFKKSIILTGGQDRRAGVYKLRTNQSYHKMADFFVYGVGLSPSGKVGAYSFDMQNNVALFNTENEEIIAKYKATGAVVNTIYFINEDEFLINSSANVVGYYRLD
jgi:WD40 repeat protein